MLALYLSVLDDRNFEEDFTEVYNTYKRLVYHTANGTILNADDLQPEKTIYVRSASRRAKCRVEAVEEINENTQKF